MTSVEKNVYDYFDSKYGCILPKRFDKLKGEFVELIESFEIYQSAKDPRDSDDKRKHLIDELGDVVIILSHINSIIGTCFEDLLINTLVKNRVREINKNYLKTNNL